MPAYDDAPECDTDECPHFEAGTCNHNCTGSTCDGPGLLPQAKTERNDTANRSESEDTMSDSKHTPGPWTINSNHVEHVEGTPDETYTTTVAIIPLIAFEGRGRDEQAANAALIAAAPDMLAALVACAEMLSEIAGTDFTMWTQEGGTLATIHAARAAIAKAEGR